MKKKSSLGTIILLIVIILLTFGIFIGFGIVSQKVSTFFRGAQGGPISKTVQTTVQSVKQIYSNFQRAWDMALNPWKYTYTANPAKPSEEVLKENYGFKIEQMVSVSPIPYFTCKNSNCSDVDIPEIIVLAPVYYHFLQPTNVLFNCSVQTSYDDVGCFKKEIFLYPQHLNLVKRGYVNTRCTVKLTYNKNNIRCHSCVFSLLNKVINISECLNKPVVFKGEGFRVNVLLSATFTTTSQTTYKTLIIPESTFIESLVRKKNVYSMLRLSQADYDTGYYYGLLGYPEVDIGRLVYNEYGYPIILFGNNWSYDVYIFEIRDLNNIKKIKSFVIKFLVPPGVDFKFLNINSNTPGALCTENMNYKITLSANNKKITPFSISCSGDECKITVGKSYIYNLIESGRDLKVNIPICIKSSSFKGDYEDLIVIANVTYVYNSVVETPYSLTYTLYKV